MNLPYLKYGFFPDEVILQILARLPMKSLFRSKCASKLWYKLVSDKYFIQLYNEMSVRNPMVQWSVLRIKFFDFTDRFYIKNFGGLFTVGFYIIKLVFMLIINIMSYITQNSTKSFGWMISKIKIKVYNNFFELPIKHWYWVMFLSQTVYASCFLWVCW